MKAQQSLKDPQLMHSAELKVYELLWVGGRELEGRERENTSVTCVNKG